jgi:hypothetical protein
MPSPMMIIGAVAGLALLAAAGMGFLLKKSYEANGALQTELASAKKVIAEKEAARQSRAVTDQAVRKMAPAEKLERLK